MKPSFVMKLCFSKYLQKENSLAWDLSPAKLLDRSNKKRAGADLMSLQQLIAAEIIIESLLQKL